MLVGVPLHGEVPIMTLHISRTCIEVEIQNGIEIVRLVPLPSLPPHITKLYVEDCNCETNLKCGPD